MNDNNVSQIEKQLTNIEAVLRQIAALQAKQLELMKSLQEKQG